MLAKQFTTEEENGISDSLSKINQKENKFPEETPSALRKHSSPSLGKKNFPLKCGLRLGNLSVLLVVILLFINDVPAKIM